jgi:hypothetical protein
LKTDDPMAVWVFVFRQPQPEDEDEKEARAQAQLLWLEQWNPPEETMQ